MNVCAPSLEPMLWGARGIRVYAIVVSAVAAPSAQIRCSSRFVDSPRLNVVSRETTPLPEWLGFESLPPARLGEESLRILPSHVREPQATRFLEVQPRRSE